MSGQGSRWLLASLGLLVAVAMSAPELASADERLPARNIRRPIVSPAGVLDLAAEGTFRYARGGADASSASPNTGVGVLGSLAYGVTDFLMIGGTPFPTEVWPETDLGNPSAFVGVGIPTEGFSLAAFGRVTFPLADESSFRIDAALPVWIDLGPSVRLVTGGDVGLLFADEVGIDISGHLGALFQLSDDVFVGVETRTTFFALEPENVNVGAQLSTGYTFASDLGAGADLTLRVGFPQLFRPTNGDRPFDIGTFEAGVGIRVFFYR